MRRQTLSGTMLMSVVADVGVGGQQHAVLLVAATGEQNDAAGHGPDAHETRRREGHFYVG